MRDVFGLMLCAVPGAGETLVESILAAYPTWHTLWAAYKAAQAQARSRGQDPGRAAEAMLAGLPVGGGGGGGGSGSGYNGASQSGGGGCSGVSLAAAAGVAGSSRSVGGEVSRKVYRLLFAAAPAAAAAM